MATQPPAHLAEAFAILNDGRARLGLPAFAWDDRLARCAQELCDHNWAVYTAGGLVEGHWDQGGRRERAGWAPGWTAPPRGRRINGNFGEIGTGAVCGPSGRWPADPEGMSYPPRPAAAFARDLVAFLTGPTIENDGHQIDFKAGFTHAGIGWREGMFSVTFGYLP